MADKKISALDGATTPLAGTEVLPIVQGGSTVNVSVANLTAGRALSALSFIPSGSTVPTNGVYLPAANSVGTATDNIERTRVTPTGYLKVSNDGIYTAIGVPFHEFNQSDASQGVVTLYGNNASTTAAGMLFLQTARNTTDNTYYVISYYNSAAAAYRFRVADSGNVTNTNNSYGAISDAKLKENIVDATPKLDKLNQVRIVNYNLIGDEQKQLGVIAQDLEQIFPGMVDESLDRDKDGNDLGTTTKSVKYSVFVPMLIKAIQEQQSLIIDLQARLTKAGL